MKTNMEVGKEDKRKRKGSKGIRLCKRKVGRYGREQGGRGDKEEGKRYG